MASERLVIIPTFNEIENVRDMIRTVMSLDPAFDVLIVDDNSPDGTAGVVREFMETYPGRLHLEVREGKQGLGTAYVHGFQWGLERGYEYLFEMDCDFSHDPHDLPRLWAACAQEGADLAIGSRYSSGVNVVNWPISRVLLSYFASTYVRWITGMRIRDATAGFKCYHRRVLACILTEPVRFVGYAFQIEMKFKAYKYGFRLKEVPIIFTDRQKGNSKMSGGIIREAILGVIWLKLNSLSRRWDRPKALSVEH